MLRHLGLTENAAIIENALLYTLEQGVHTGDFGDKTKVRSIPLNLQKPSSPILVKSLSRMPKDFTK